MFVTADPALLLACSVSAASTALSHFSFSFSHGKQRPLLLKCILLAAEFAGAVVGAVALKQDGYPAVTLPQLEEASLALRAGRVAGRIDGCMVGFNLPIGTTPEFHPELKQTNN